MNALTLTPSRKGLVNAGVSTTDPAGTGVFSPAEGTGHALWREDPQATLGIEAAAFSLGHAEKVTPACIGIL